MISKNKFIFACCFWSFLLQAQSGYIIKNTTVFDGEFIIPETSVKIKSDKIVDISSSLEEIENFEIIDGKGKFLMPALSNAHVHAWSPMFLKEAAKAGVLNLMDMHGIEHFQQAMVNLKDSTQYARFYRAGFAATAPNGHGTQFGFSVPTLVKPEDAKQFIEERQNANVDYIKIIVEPSKETLTFPTVEALVKEAHNASLKTVVHVSYLEDAEQVLKLKADGLAHIWRDEQIGEERLQLLAKNETFFVIPTLLTTFKAIDYLGENAEGYLTKEQLLEEVKKLQNAGVSILAGTDPPNLQINFGTDLYEELFLFQKAGISTIEVLKTATINIAEAFSLEHYGRIKKGFKADLILIDGNPVKNLEDLKMIEKVWKDGKLIDRE
jgi:imidazolonepropionase-like amidohydrolase